MNFSKAQIFVTGGAGFIGSAFISVAFSELFECSMINFDALTHTGISTSQGARHRRQACRKQLHGARKIPLGFEDARSGAYRDYCAKQYGIEVGG